MRNDFIFNQKIPSAEVAVGIIRHLSDEMSSVKTRGNNLNQDVISKSSMTLIRWISPEEGFVKINCDGSPFKITWPHVEECLEIIGGLILWVLHVNWVIVLFCKQNYGQCFTG